MKASNTATGIRALAQSLLEWLTLDHEPQLQTLLVRASASDTQRTTAAAQHGDAAAYCPRSLKAGSGVTWP